MVGTVQQNVEAYDKWRTWLNAPGHSKEVLEHWAECSDECEFNCDYCVWSIVGLQGEAILEFLGRVQKIVDGLVEEFYRHPNWDEDECEEYGYEMGFLVNLYFEYGLES